MPLKYFIKRHNLYSTPKDELLYTFQELYDYARYHFETEEAFIKAHAYPKLELHKKSHQTFVKKLDELYQKFEGENQENLKELVLSIFNFLKNWLFSHIITLDKEIEVYLKEVSTETPVEVNLYKLYGFLSKNESLEKLDQLIKRGEAKTISFILFDIDDFYLINLRYGFDVGDLVLEDFAKHLYKNLKEDQLWLAKFEGDRFGILLTDEQNFLKTFSTIKKVFQVTENYQFTLIKNQKVEIIRFNISLGLVVYPKHGNDPKDLLIKAEIAVKKAKEEGKNRWVMFSEEDYVEIKKLDRIKNLLDEALEKELVFPFVQPIFSAKTQKVIGGEVLLRVFCEEEKRFISAGEFIKFALKSNYLDRLEEVMFKKFKDYLKFYKFKNYMIFINRSITSFEKFERLIYEMEQWIDLVQKFKVKLVLEVTEASLIDFIDLVFFIKEKAKQNNILLAIDDFGAGHASFGYLLKFKPDFIKIDGDFVKASFHSEDNLKVLKGIIRLARDLKIKTIAEFVENKEIMDMLVRAKVDYLQGYYLAKPMSIEDFVKSYLTK
ncbi:MAG: Diguanylate cyclase/phosphodiesterase [Thermodesulfobacterium sp. 37_54]|nr:MAG: Diguanylate cyclase/phosphodiesterase [Thermodesulfobacterium sp. 37_54]KUK18840.1 MAG: Diguanylate cyclase/phosphodiesterase [Thermodesulfobacterium commune]